jgi:uncharacterized protein HemX
MAKTAKGEKNIDIGLILVIVLMVVSLGGGLWLTGQSILARVEMASVQTRSQLATIHTETFELRKQVQNLEFQLRRLTEAKPAPAPAPAAAPGAAPGK